jgi:hypothetical protein
MKNYADFVNEGAISTNPKFGGGAKNAPEIQGMIDELIRLNAGFKKYNMTATTLRGMWIIELPTTGLPLKVIQKIAAIIPDFSLIINPFSATPGLCIDTHIKAVY